MLNHLNTTGMSEVSWTRRNNSGCTLRGSKWHRSRHGIQLAVSWAAQQKCLSVTIKASKIFCYAETGRGNNTENTSSLFRSSLYYPRKQWGEIAQIKQNHRHYEIEIKVLMGRRNATNIEVQRSQIKPNPTKQNHTTQNSLNSSIVYPGSSQFRQTMHG